MENNDLLELKTESTSKSSNIKWEDKIVGVARKPKVPLKNARTIITVASFGFFISHIHSFSLTGNKNVYTLNQGTNREKYFLSEHIKLQLPTLVGNEHLLSIFFLIGRVCSIYRQAMDLILGQNRLNSSEMGSKVLITAPTSSLQLQIFH